MDLTRATTRWQQLTVVALVALTTVAFWTPAPDAFGLPKATLLWLGAIVLVVLGVTRIAFERVVRLPRSPWVIAVLVFVVAVLITTLTSPTLALSVVGEYNRYTGLLSYAAFAIVGLTVLRTFDVDEVALLFKVLTVVLLVVGVYGLLQVLDADPYEFGVEDLGTVGTMGNSNIFAGLLAIGVPAAVWQALTVTASREWRIAGAVAAGLGLLVAIGTKSFQGPAAAIPGALVVVAVWLGTEDGRATREATLGRLGDARRVAIGVGALVALMAAGGAALATRGGLESGFIERGDFWRAALTMWGDDPLLGVGFDTYGQHFAADRPEGHALRYASTHAESAHSVILNLLAGGGLLVGLTWLAVVAVTGWALVRGLKRLDGPERTLLGGLGGAWVAYLIQSLVSFDVPTLGLLHFILAGSIVAIGVPPHWDERRFGRPPRATGRRGSERYVVPSSTYALIGVAVVLGLVGAWWATRPLRADLTAAHAQNQFDDQDIDGARASLRKATELAPWQGRYWILRAQFAEAEREVFEAIEHAEEAARREPGSAQYALTAGQHVAAYGEAGEADEWFAEAMARDPNNPVVWQGVAAWAIDADPELALELAQRVDARESTKATKVLLARAMRANGHEEEGEGILREMVAADPFSTGTVLLQEIQAADPELAAELADVLIDADPDGSSTWFSYGEFLRAAGDLAGARDAYERALELDETNYQAVNAIYALDAEEDAVAAGG